MTRSLTNKMAGFLARRTSRRGFLARTGVVGAALAMDPVSYVLRPTSAYASVCGSGASCASGWTAFCVTVNKGVNQCPPGSYTAGWWKADHAGVCGGGPRYYIDCNAYCVNGRRGHYTCGCRCAPGHTCDQRHTCCNQFRYGQCHQDISCYGPVVCRVISCVPPWKWAPCSKSAATDNRTLSHSAPDLPHTWDAVERRYVSMDGHASPLGASVGPRHHVLTGLLQNYQHGLLAWSHHTPASMLLTAVADAYRHRGGPRGRFGFPTHDERPARSGHGRLARFVHGALFVHADLVAHAFEGPLLHRWVDLVDTASPLGPPTGSVLSAGVDDGLVAHFQHGLLLWSSASGRHEVAGSDAARYSALDAQQGYLGFPVTDTVTTPDGRGSMTSFQHGAIVANPQTGAWDVPAEAFAYWQQSGGVTGPLGYPIGGPVMVPVGSATRSPFAGGDVFSSPSAGTHSVRPPVLATYDAVGGPAGPLGLPTTDLVPTSSPTSTQTFQGGTITYDATTGTCTTQYSSGPPPSG